MESPLKFSKNEICSNKDRSKTVLVDVNRQACAVCSPALNRQTFVYIQSNEYTGFPEVGPSATATWCANNAARISLQ